MTNDTIRSPETIPTPDTIATPDERIALVKEYFRKVDTGATDLFDMFAEDAQVFFPGFGVARGKSEILKMVVGLSSALSTFEHDESRMTFTQDNNRLVVEGAEAGTFVDGKPFPGDARSGGLFCSVFEFEGTLFSRMHIYADPDLAGQRPALFTWDSATSNEK